VATALEGTSTVTNCHPPRSGVRAPTASGVPATVGAPVKLGLSAPVASTQTGIPVSYTATIQDANGNTVTAASSVITFTSTGVAGTFSPSATVNATNGSAAATFTASAAGSTTIAVSATGLSGASTTLTVSAPAGGSGQSLFTGQTPAIASASDGVPYELGMKFTVSTSGVITALRFWKALGDTGSHIGRIWSESGTLLASVTFTGESASGWQQQALSSPLAIQTGATYVVSVNIGSRYPFTLSGLHTQITNGSIASVADGNNGVYGNPFAFPSSAYLSSNYFRDIVFVPDVASGPPAKLALLPVTASTQTGVPVTYTAIVQDVDGNTVTSATNGVTFTVSGVSGMFDPSTIEGPITPTRGQATTSFTPTTVGTATITA